MQYAKALSGGTEDAITRLSEGEDDQDEMFWAMLGDEAWASADYWQWRKGAANVDPRAWLVEDGAGRVRSPMCLFSRFRRSLFYAGHAFDDVVDAPGSQVVGLRRRLHLGILRGCWA